MKIRVEKPTPADAAAVGGCATGNEEPAVFHWRCDTGETCHLLGGRVRAVSNDGEAAEVETADIAIFPAGPRCAEVYAPVRQYYCVG